jgi:hypothetical protein
MGKGFVRIYRSEADIPQLWENAALFCVYQKLKMVALWPEGVIKRPSRVLARQCAVSRNTLYKAIGELEKLGLLDVDISDRNTWALRVKYVEQEPRQNTPLGEPEAADEAQLSNETENAAPSVLEPAMAAHFVGSTQMVPAGSKNEPIPVPVVQNLNQGGSKNEPVAVQNLNQPPLYRDYLYINNIYNPHNPPTLAQKDAGFELFWNAYPNKRGKQAALKKWTTGKYNPADILPTLEKQKKLRDWVKADGKFVPHARTYLNQKRYEDVLPSGEEYYTLDFKQPKTEREVLLTAWLEATNPDLLKNDNQKINSAFEPDRVLFEQIVVKCGGNLQEAFAVLRHGWRLGCASLRAIAERAASYIDDLRENKK